ncbi:phosphoenolpyruvate--protein phosphotransferase [Microbacterium neungamense]|uniref:phosphoenolpyruvate--protein phosphotransferase n=1 Tax=Microbacterium neungamense TaxID=2810535 RepID=UPI00217E9B4E|nr:phosphoenolpyruvate--protein phosphotransferase [Microbacterium neungamense]UWF78003.1 phosphoenolpyruvate--protein phosphotransferase [Microbacterium neungamense]
MIGIVAVSHSAGLAEAARELALQMVPGDGAPLRVAAGAGTDADGRPILGTDAVLVAAAIDELAARCDGVLVLMDLGSAVMSAELALELRSSDVPVRLVPAPFVEGMLAAAVSASAGAPLEAVAAEAEAALQAKAAHLGEDIAAASGSAGASIAAPAGPETVRVVRVRNALGIHARPAALIAEAAGSADVRLRRLPAGPEAGAASLSRLLALGARAGDEVQVRGSGAGADAAVERIAALFADGFGEEIAAGAGGEGSGTRARPGPDRDVTRARQIPASAAPIDDADAGESPAPDDGAALPPGTVLRGRGVSPGVAAAPVAHPSPAIAEPEPADPLLAAEREAEAARIAPAAAAVAAGFAARAEAASGETRAILDATRLLAADPDLVADAAARVRTEGLSAARAVWEAASAQAEALVGLGGRTAERAADVRDIRNRIVAVLHGREPASVPEREAPFVLVATDLAPSDTAALAGSACAALVTEQGGPTSHTAIIARALGLPAVVAAPGAAGIPDGTLVLVDGETGTVTMDPAEDELAAARAAADARAFDGDGRLADGTPLPLLANVGGPADAVQAAGAAAQGIGLFRTEFCFLDRAAAPTVEEQTIAYRGVLTPFAGRKVVVRTLDAGSDKPLPFATPEHEENPALGLRGLRVSWRNPALLHDQLRALALAAAEEQAHVEVMAPMVATIEEARDFTAAARAAGLERVGVMIETPAAALMAEELLEVVDFVSIGTNDLAQYAMAADRQHPALGALNDPWQPAVLRLIATIGSAGQTAGAPVGVCGEAGGDPRLAPVLVGLGATSLSMTPRALGRVARALAAVTAEQCRAAADAALEAATAADARAAASAVLR